MSDYLPSAPLRRALARLGRQDLLDRLHAIRALSAARGLHFLDDHSRPRTIDLASVPWVLTGAQVAFFRQLVRLIVDGLVQLPQLYAQRPEIRALLPFDRRQEAWLSLAGRVTRPPLAVLGRMDSTAQYDHARWRTGFEMLEPNAVGVGGVHYAPTACSIILDALGDVLRRALPGRRILPTTDPRGLLLEECSWVAQRHGHAVRRIALIENRDFTTGTDEFSSLAAYIRQQGLDALVADPRELSWRRGRLFARGQAVDLLYRDCELGEFVDMERDGRRLTGLRHAIRDGRLISGLMWEFDLKSAWELFTDARYADWFSSAQQRAFRAYLPWTRLVRQATATDPSGKRCDLPAYIRREQRRLVLKPNALYGGQGVVIGARATRSAWDAALRKALRGATRYVVQRAARIGTERFPMLHHGAARVVERSVVSGFFFNSSGVGLIGRFADDPVVNVSRGGGLLAALMVQ